MIENDTLTQWGVLGMRWGVRRSRPKSGYSAGRLKKKDPPKLNKPEKKINVKELSDQELSDLIRRLDNEKRYKDYMSAQKGSAGAEKAKAFVTSVLEKSGKAVATATVTYVLGTAVNKAFKANVVNVGKGISPSTKKDD